MWQSGLTVSTFNVDFRYIHHPPRISSAKLAILAAGYNHLFLLSYFKGREDLNALNVVISEL
jgi:hypothetical protein